LVSLWWYTMLHGQRIINFARNRFLPVHYSTCLLRTCKLSTLLKTGFYWPHLFLFTPPPQISLFLWWCLFSRWFPNAFLQVFIIEQCVLNVQPTPFSFFIAVVTSYKCSIYEAPYYVILSSTFVVSSYFAKNILNFYYSEAFLLFILIPFPRVFPHTAHCTPLE
jgi:hypothetical protein